MNSSGCWDVHKIYEEIQNTNLHVREDLLNEILDPKVERGEKSSSSDNPTSNVPADPSTSPRGKNVAKGD